MSQPTSLRGPLDPRPLIALLAIPIVGFGPSLAYYLNRSQWLNYVTIDLAVPMSPAVEAYGWASGLGGLGFVAGGLLGLLIGGWGTAAIGTLLMMVASFALLGTSDADLWMLAGPLWLSTFGRGVMTLGLFIALCDAFRGERAWLVVTAGALSAAGLNLSVLLLPPVNQFGLPATTVFVGSGLILGVSFLAIVGAGAAWLALGQRFPEASETRRRVEALPTLFAFVMAGLTGIGLAGLYHASSVVFQLLSAPSAAPGLRDTAQFLNPVVVSLASVVLAGVGLALYAFKARAIALPVVVVGLHLAIAGTLLLVLPETPELGHMLGALSLHSLAEVVILPFALLAMSWRVHWRLLALVLMSWRGSLFVVDVILSNQEVAFDLAEPHSAVAVLPLVLLFLSAGAIAALGLAYWLITRDRAEASSPPPPHQSHPA